MNSTSGSVTKHITIFRCVFLVFSFHKLKAPIHACRKATQVRCLVFVERIITAKVIERVMKTMTWFSDFTIAYLTGTNTSVDALTPKVQKETLECFRSGKVRTCIHPIRFEINTFWWVPLTSLFLSYIFPYSFYHYRSIYYLLLMWLRRELMCRTVLLWYGLIYQKQFEVMSSLGDELVRLNLCIY